MANEWDDYAKEWDSNEATHVFADSVFEQLTQLVSLEGKSVLDFGCGTGLLSERMSNGVKSIVALDSSEAMIEELDKKELANVEPIVDLMSRGLVAQHPAFRKQFDIAVASSVCGFLPNYQDTMDVIYSILESNGIFIQWDWLAENESSEIGMTKDRIYSTLYSIGFAEVEISTPFALDTTQGKKWVVMGVGRKSL